MAGDMEVIFALLPSSQKLMQEKADADREERYRMRAERVLMTMSPAKSSPTPLPPAAPLPPPPRRTAAAAAPPKTADAERVASLVASIEETLSGEVAPRPVGAAA